jgi:hypothetical protein
MKINVCFDDEFVVVAVMVIKPNPCVSHVTFETYDVHNVNQTEHD